MELKLIIDGCGKESSHKTPIHEVHDERDERLYNQIYLDIRGLLEQGTELDGSLELAGSEVEVSSMRMCKNWECTSFVSANSRSSF
jgi:hypothetical protein